MHAFLSLAALALSVQTDPTPPRHFLGDTPFSFESAGELRQIRSQSVARPEDWLIKATDWEVDADSVYVAASIFEGRQGTQMNRDFLKKAVDEFVQGMESGKDKAEDLVKEPVEIDDQIAQRASYRVGKGSDGFFVQSLFLTSGTNLYSVVAVYFEESGKSAEAAKKVVDSVRFKKPLESQLSGISR